MLVRVHASEVSLAPPRVKAQVLVFKGSHKGKSGLVVEIIDDKDVMVSIGPNLELFRISTCAWIHAY